MSVGPSESWQRWEPSKTQPWDLRRVWHLHRRAGFGATWAELQRDVGDGVDLTVNRFLDGTLKSDGAPANFEQMASAIGTAAASSGNPERLKAWWVYRMLYSPDPLAERLTLMWHNHFATSNRKVDDVELMWQQNEQMRSHCRGSFRDLILAVTKHPAMLLWLDASANRREHPNENLARELMELFTLGVGHYSEADVRDAARSLTGWAVSRDQFFFASRHHDDRTKTVLGHTGKLTGDDLVELLLRQPATAERLAWRLCDAFLGENVATADDVAELGSRLQECELDIGTGVETILRSKLFWSDENLRSRVAGPAEFFIGAVRALELTSPPPSTLLLSEQFADAGQDLFYPPNVFGWPGGRTWINTRSILARSRFVATIIAGDGHRPPQPLDAMKLAGDTYGVNTQSHDELSAFFAGLLLGEAPSARESLSQEESVGDVAVNQIVQQLLTSAEALLC